MNTLKSKYQSHDITKQIIQALHNNGYANTVIITSNLNLLQKLTIILSKKDITLVYKKPFIKTPFASLIISSLDLIIYDFKQLYLLRLLKEPLINFYQEKIIDFIEIKAMRSIKMEVGFLGIKKMVAKMPEATELLNKIEYRLLLIKNVKSKEIKHYVHLTLKYLKNFIQITKELSLFFKTIVSNTTHPICSVEEYKSLLLYFMEDYYQTMPNSAKNAIYAFDYKEIPFILEPNIIIDQDQELSNDFTVTANYIQDKNIIRVGNQVEDTYTIEKNSEHYNGANYHSNNFYYNPPSCNRPKHLTSTMVQSLISNPYEFYLKYILKLSELEPIGKKPSNLELGIILHEIFAKFSINRKILFEEVWDHSQKVLLKYSNTYSYVKHLWNKKIEAIIKQFIDFHNSRLLNLHDIESEKTLSAQLVGVTISARLDRIEHLKGNKIAIIDYKTGVIPTKSELINYNKAQILIQGITAINNIKQPISELMYLGFENNSLTLSTTQDLKTIEKFKIFLEELLEKYINQETPFI